MSGENWRTDPSRDETTSRYVKGITSSDWRQSTPRRMGQNPGTPNYAPQASTIHFMGDRSRYEYTPGTVALVWNFTEDRNTMDQSKIDRQKEDLLTSNIPGTKGFNVFVKSRKVIVIACFTDHYVALPIYTHKGLGLTSKIEMKDEYVSIRNKPGLDHYSEPETDHGCIYTTTTAQEATGARVIAPHANVWFAYPQALPYRNRVIFVGELDPGSLSKLCELYMMAMKNALSTTLTRVDHSLWSDAPYGLGSETRQRLADRAESEN